MSARRGRGRGEAIRQLLAQQKLQQGIDKQTPEDGGGDGGDNTQDSGVGPSLDPAKGNIKTVETDRLTEQFPTPSSSQPLPSTSKGGTGRGRADFLKKLLSSVPADPGPICLGRARLFQEARSRHESLLAETKEMQSLTKGMDDVVIKEKKKEPEAIVRTGTRGIPTFAVCNYVRLQSDPNKGVFEYDVDFNPNIDSRNLRIKYVNEHRDKFGGTKTFDGARLYLPILLDDKETTLISTNLGDNQKIEIKLIYKRQKPLRECIQLYNILFDRIMRTLNYVRFDRKQYDPTMPKIIPQHKLEVWPGYVTAVDEYEGGVMLCCDVSHRLLNQRTVLETLREIYHVNPPQFQENAKKALLGSIVLTRYNNKTYRVDDISFASNPLATFQTQTGQISYVDYYKQHYNITINDKTQPLLISMKQRRVAGKEIPEELMFCLIPEICYVTGLRDDLRADNRVMRDIATFTRVTPNQRMAALKKFYTNVNTNPEAKQILDSWGLKLSDHPEELTGRQLDDEMIYFAKQTCPAGQNADFGRYATNNILLRVVNLNDWLLIHTINDKRTARSFIDCLEKNSRPMGIKVNKPRIEILENDRTESYVNALRNLIKASTQIVVLICPTSRDDRYAAIKKICCTEIPIPSQVINSRTLSNESKNRSIVQKIALQMNCKLGGTLWSVKIPFQNVMICGIDAYHDPAQKGNSVAAFVASINNTYTRWYSRAGIQSRKEELVNGLCVSLKYALNAYKEANECLPDRIIIFRDGVGDGQLNMCKEYEIPQLEQACNMESPTYNPDFTFIVVQKRINTRIFLDLAKGEVQNPNPGFIVDHTVTRKYLYDFFLISQSVRQGTVSPTHYVVIHDSAGFSPDIIQRLSYKLCFLYYNWPGTVRVPACCQYAHKLAYLVGQSIKRPTAEKLADKLFYL